ncbi:ABC transporter permease [Microbacterium invictum]|uniref:ABC-type transport system involved in multi-copper enzyme maturation permease subunit n=1 Tax=Microbacterium invictum TaxID=515415 RepID=A0AA40SRZ9_9MICO|nr:MULTISPECIES: ABC transporter permease [Microbacterium]MBB4141337.1 ABC-type transport system involved in multi-copper enzyme maturation permease subunit [Microbacterium invictum]
MSTLTAVSPPRPAYASALRGAFALSRRRVVVWVSLGVWVFCIAVFAYLVSYLSTAGAEWYTPEQQRTVVDAMLPAGTSFYALASLPLYGAPQFAILGAILGSSDHSRGTIRTLVSRFPRRTSFIGARLTNLAIVGVLVAIVTLLSSVLCSLGIAAVAGRSSPFPPLPDLATTAAAIWLVAATFLFIGFAVGTLTRSVIAAAAISVGWVLGIESLLVGMLAPVVSALASIQGVLPVGATSSLAAGFVPAGQQTVPALTAATSPGVAVVVLLVWTTIAGATSFALLRRRDLT